MKPRKARRVPRRTPAEDVWQTRNRLWQQSVGNIMDALAAIRSDIESQRRALGALTMKLGELGWAGAKIAPCPFCGLAEGLGHRAQCPRLAYVDGPLPPNTPADGQTPPPMGL